MEDQGAQHRREANGIQSLGETKNRLKGREGLRVLAEEKVLLRWTHKRHRPAASTAFQAELVSGCYAN